MGMSPVSATRKVLAALRDLGLADDDERVNPNGGVMPWVPPAPGWPFNAFRDGRAVVPQLGDMP